MRFKGRDIGDRPGPARAARAGAELPAGPDLPGADSPRDPPGGRRLAPRARAAIPRLPRRGREVRPRSRTRRRALRAGRASFAAPSRTLPQGDKKLLDVASAFALRPEAILLDEPTSGVSTRDKTAVMEMLVRASRGIGVQAILLVEHDMDIVFGYSDRIVALQQGRILADTTPEGLRAGRRSGGSGGWPAPAAAGGSQGIWPLMLRLHGIDVFIQSSHILRDVSLEVDPGALVCLVGRNGAGKTTTLRTVMGYLRPARGRIELDGAPIAGLPTHAIARRGVGYAPEEGGIFGDLTVAENVEIATWTRPGGSPRRRADRACIPGVPTSARLRRARRDSPVRGRAQDARDRPGPGPGPPALAAR